MSGAGGVEEGPAWEFALSAARLTGHIERLDKRGQRR